jgi:hypothetical protein
MEYLVTWQIEIDADSPQIAAQKALEIQRDSSSIATVFDVCNTSNGLTWKDIDAVNICPHCDTDNTGLDRDDCVRCGLSITHS